MIQIETADVVRESGSENVKEYDATKNSLHKQIIKLEKQAKELQELSNREKTMIIDLQITLEWDSRSA